jgi:ribokinase
VVVTRGEQGALIVIDEAATSFVPSAAVDVVDTTGAGDAFSCALTVALAGGTSLADAVAFAGCAGALVCTRLGVIPALPDRASVEACLAERGDERG